MMDAQQAEVTQSETEAAERPVWESLKRGWLGRCPECGQGRLLEKYVAVTDACSACGLKFDGHRADDAPPYFTMFIVAHLLTPVLIIYWILYKPSLATILALGIGVMVVASLLLLPRIKGAFIGLQWAKRMHGFSPNQEAEIYGNQ